MSRIDWRYAAGFFDGEGSIGIHRITKNGHEAYYCRLSITNTYRPVLEDIAAWFGARTYLHTRARAERRIVFVLVTHDQLVVAHALRGMLPHLREKAPRARVALAFLESRSRVPRGLRRGRGYTTGERARYRQMRALNRRAA